MSFDYINEAFKRLSLLEEEMFDVSNTGMSSLADLVDENNSEDNEVVRIIDSNASTDEDIEESYIGKFVLRCNVCNSNILKSKDDVDVEDDLVNPETVCPCCGETEGFKLIGIISPVQTEVSDSEEDVAVDEEAPEEQEINSTENNDEEINVSSEPSEKSDKDFKESISRATKFSNSLSEEFKAVTIVTDDQKMEMTSEENGKVVVTTEPVAETKVESEDVSTTENVEEVVTPPSEEDIDAILSETETVAEETSETNPEEDSTQEEESVSETELDTEEPASTDTEEEVDVDIDELDDTSFDELGEAFLREVYENVKSFKTTGVSSNKNTMILEGVVTFNSGVEKNTGFIMNPSDISKSGEIRFKGFNKHLSESKNSISLVGNVSNKKLTFESLRYNYTIDDTPVKGTVRRK